MLRTLKSLLIVLTILSTIFVRTIQADSCKTPESKCVDDCNKIIDAAKKTIADRDQLIADQSKTITDQMIQMNDISRDRDSARESLTEWDHNPFILLGLGILVGGAGVLYLDHR